MGHCYRDDFPIFSEERNKDVIYFDNAATAQRPFPVIEAVSRFYRENNANPLRGLYDLSGRATEAYEDARHTVAEFIHAKDCEIVFTRNATESLNLVAYSWGRAFLHAGDKVAVSIMEHHSNILPWQMACRETGAELVYLECDKATGEFPAAELDKIAPGVKAVAIAQVSNVLGATNPVQEIVRRAHAVGAVAVVDGAQSVPHIPVDVKALDADFFAFSGHKLCGPMGIGVLYGKKALLDAMPPFLRGGEMIEYVTRDGATWTEVPYKFEAGTVNAAGAVGLAAAVRYVQDVGLDEIAAHDNRLAALLMDEMRRIPFVSIIGSPDSSKHCGIVTFTIADVHPHDIAAVLDSERIAIRAGHHCAQPLGDYLGVPASARASVYFYNTEAEVRIFAEKLAHVREWMGYGN